MLNKKALISIDPADFVDIKTMGSDRMYNRFPILKNVLLSHLDEESVSFLAEPVVENQGETVVWLVPIWNQIPRRFVELGDDEKPRYSSLVAKIRLKFEDAREDVADKGVKKILSDIIDTIANENIYCYDDKVVLAPWGMRPNKNNPIGPGGQVFFGAKKIQLVFKVDSTKAKFGNGSDSWRVNLEKGASVESKVLPLVLITDDKYKFVGWEPNPLGMVPSTTTEFNARFESIKPATVECRFESGAHGTLKGIVSFQKEIGSTFESSEIPVVEPADGYRFAGWDIDPLSVRVDGPAVFTAKYEEVIVQPEPERPSMVECRFLDGDHGWISGNSVIRRPAGSSLSSSDIPEVSCEDGYEFVGWDVNPLASLLTGNMTFTAQYASNGIQCHFLAGEHGKLDGTTDWIKPKNSCFSESELPKVITSDGYKFKGWDINPLTTPIVKPMTYTPVYDETLWAKILNFFKRIWAFIIAKGCLKWLLFLLLFIFLLFLLSKCSEIEAGAGCCSRKCDVCGTHHPDGECPGSQKCPGCGGDHPESECPNVGGSPSRGSEVSRPGNRVPDGEGYGNGVPATGGDILGDNHQLPSTPVIPPSVGEEIPVRPGKPGTGEPDVIANRLAVFFEEDNADMQGWVNKFKELYPSESYQVIGSDPNSELIVIQIPEAERDRIREQLPQQMGDFKFFVVDETLYKQVSVSQSNSKQSTPGWHIKYTNLKDAHKITRGDSSIVIAVVDDGFELSHPMFAGRVVRPYNIYTQNEALTTGSGHGIHVAGIAVGNDRFESKGALGVAPNCKVMPVQVYQEGKQGVFCSISAIASGVMYALHQGADVINISSGYHLPGLDRVSESEQREIAANKFKNEAKVWNRIAEIAKKRNVVIVFAAGNDHVLTKVLPENRSDFSISVSAVDEGGPLSSYSNYGDGSDISAPGSGIMSAAPGGKVQFMDGTSMAAPMVAGTAALLLSTNRNLTVAQILEILSKTGKSVNGNAGKCINVDAALKTAVFANGSKDVDIDKILAQIEEYEKKIKESQSAIDEYQNKIDELKKNIPNN